MILHLNAYCYAPSCLPDVITEFVNFLCKWLDCIRKWPIDFSLPLTKHKNIFLEFAVLFSKLECADELHCVTNICCFISYCSVDLQSYAISLYLGFHGWKCQVTAKSISTYSSCVTVLELSLTYDETHLCSSDHLLRSLSAFMIGVGKIWKWYRPYWNLYPELSLWRFSTSLSHACLA